MNVLTQIKEEFFLTTNNIDKQISEFLIKRLDIKDADTMRSLGLKGKSKFGNRLYLLMQLKSLPTDKQKKLKIYSDLYEMLSLKKDSSSNNYEDHFSFLISNYPQKKAIENTEKIKLILKDFMIDVQQMVKRVTTMHTLQMPQKKEGNLSSKTSLL